MESIIEQSSAQVLRMRRGLSDSAIARAMAAYQAIDAEARAYLEAQTAERIAKRFMGVLQHEVDNEVTAKVPTPICPHCGGATSQRCGFCGWPGAGAA